MGVLRVGSLSDTGVDADDGKMVLADLLLDCGTADELPSLTSSLYPACEYGSTLLAGACSLA